MGLTMQALAAGALVGLGLVLLAAGLLPAGPPELTAALARLDTPVRAQLDLAPAGPGRPVDRSRLARWSAAAGGWVGGWVAGHTPTAGPLSAPAADLRLLGVGPASFAAGRAALAAAGFAFPAVLWTAAAVAGVRLPVAAPGLLGVGLAAAGWLTPAALLRERATQARAQLRVALSAYLDLVALERAGAGSPVEALEAAAEVGHGPAFGLVRSRLILAARSGTSPYAALADLAGEVGVAELRDLADITATAADGAAVYTTLLAKSRSLRNAIATEAHAAANAASERLVFPVVLLGTGFLLLVFYPALARLLTAGQSRDDINPHRTEHPIRHQRRSRKDSPMTRFLTPPRTILRPLVLLLTAWVALLYLAAAGAAGSADGGLLARMSTSVRRRFTEARIARDAGLTTVEVAIITAVLLGLATVLVAAITVVVSRNTSKIQ